MCHVDNFDTAQYGISQDENGNSELTGDGGSQSSRIKHFTLEELEVFHIE